MHEKKKIWNSRQKSVKKQNDHGARSQNAGIYTHGKSCMKAAMTQRKSYVMNVLKAASHVTRSLAVCM